tara:strand:- start:269 stop:412 length:144 start_codon:yes stop_codon:yes gene_type:complete
LGFTAQELAARDQDLERLHEQFKACELADKERGTAKRNNRVDPIGMF